MRGVRSRRGESSTTRNVRTAVWDTKPRKSLRRPRQQASTQLCERQGIQTPSLAPRAPPSRLKPEREQLKLVVFLRERKRGQVTASHHSKNRKASDNLARRIEMALRCRHIKALRPLSGAS